jgi:hypothetical protein
VKLVFRRRIPVLERMVLVESGERELFQKLLPGFYQVCPQIDLVTCYGGAPDSFRPEAGHMFQIADYQGPEGRTRLVTELCTRDYSAIGIICSGQPIMTKWKWLLAARVPSKLFIVNENCDYFWFDYSQWRIIRHFILYRAGLSGAGAVITITRALIFPFTVLFLIAYAATVHTRRWLRLLVRL